MFDLSYFLGNDGFQNMFVYQPTFHMLDLKVDKGIKCAVGWKYASKLIQLYFTFLHNIKLLDTKQEFNSIKVF